MTLCTPPQLFSNTMRSIYKQWQNDTNFILFSCNLFLHVFSQNLVNTSPEGSKTSSYISVGRESNILMCKKMDFRSILHQNVTIYVETKEDVYSKKAFIFINFQ